MTNDEHRKACIEAMEEAFYKRTSGEPTSIYEAMIAVFDSIRTAGVRAVPIVATEEMMRVSDVLCEGLLFTDTLPIDEMWIAMSSAGDLTRERYHGNKK
jgi:hypothetical protein